MAEELRNYTPGLYDKIRLGGQDIVSALGGHKYFAQDFGKGVADLASVLPGTGNVIAGSQLDSNAGLLHNAAAAMGAVMPAAKVATKAAAPVGDALEQEMAHILSELNKPVSQKSAEFVEQKIAPKTKPTWDQFHDAALSLNLKPDHKLFPESDWYHNTYLDYLKGYNPNDYQYFLEAHGLVSPKAPSPTVPPKNPFEAMADSGDYTDLDKLKGDAYVKAQAKSKGILAKGQQKLDDLTFDAQNKFSDIADTFKEKWNSIVKSGDYSRAIQPFDEFHNAQNTSAKAPLTFDNAQIDPKELGFNTEFPLYKGRTGAASVQDFESLPDPKQKAYEKGLFFTDDPSIASSYHSVLDKGKDVDQFVARPQSPMAVDWKTATGIPYYDENHMSPLIDAAHKKGADFLAINGIQDLGGKQNQFVVLDPKIMRYPNAQFDPTKLHLNNLLAGLGGAAVVSPLLFGGNDGQ